MASLWCFPHGKRHFPRGKGSPAEAFCSLKGFSSSWTKGLLGLKEQRLPENPRKALPTVRPRLLHRACFPHLLHFMLQLLKPFLCLLIRSKYNWGSQRLQLSVTNFSSNFHSSSNFQPFTEPDPALVSSTLSPFSTLSNTQNILLNANEVFSVLSKSSPVSISYCRPLLMHSSSEPCHGFCRYSQIHGYR